MYGQAPESQARGRSARQDDLERRAALLAVAHADGAVVGLGDPARDREPEPRPARRAPAGALTVAVEDRRALRGGDPRARVGHLDDDRLALAARAHDDAAAARRELEGVGYEVVERLPELLGVRPQLQVERPVEHEGHATA